MDSRINFQGIEEIVSSLVADADQFAYPIGRKAMSLSIATKRNQGFCR